MTCNCKRRCQAFHWYCEIHGNIEGNEYRITHPNWQEDFKNNVESGWIRYVDCGSPYWKPYSKELYEFLREINHPFKVVSNEFDQ